MNVPGDRSQQPLARKALRNTEDPKHKNQQDPDDRHHFPEQILIHERFFMIPRNNPAKIIRETCRECFVASIWSWLLPLVWSPAPPRPWSLPPADYLEGP